MQGGVSWIMYKGQEILFEDHAQDNTEEHLFARMDKTKEMVANSQKTDILVLLDLRGIFMVKPVMEKSMEIGKAIQPYVKKTALVGMAGGGVKTVLFKLGQKLLPTMNSRTFDTLEEAKEWLVSE